MWAKVKRWLKGSRLSKKWQARVVEAYVESSLLYNCQVRVWQKSETKRLQKWVDKCYRYVWSDRNGQPLRQMQERHLNMQDVRTSLNIRSIEWKIEKRVLERIGNIFRMENDKLVKIAVLGWMKELEGLDKRPGKKRKTVLYWKQVLSNAGIDWTDIERICAQRSDWRRAINQRMSHLDEWERQKGHRYEWAPGVVPLNRNVRAPRGLVCEYEGCGKVCKSKAGLVAHQRRIHRPAEERVQFFCSKCNKLCETAGAKVNHERAWYGGMDEGGEQKTV